MWPSWVFGLSGFQSAPPIKTVFQTSIKVHGSWLKAPAAARGPRPGSSLGLEPWAIHNRLIDVYKKWRTNNMQYGKIKVGNQIQSWKYEVQTLVVSGNIQFRNQIQNRPKKQVSNTVLMFRQSVETHFEVLSIRSMRLDILRMLIRWISAVRSYQIGPQIGCFWSPHKSSLL